VAWSEALLLNYFFVPAAPIRFIARQRVQNALARANYYPKEHDTYPKV
jgi:hypothetical protein